MGGAVSLLEQTDWEKAHGKIYPLGMEDVKIEFVGQGSTPQWTPTITTTARISSDGHQSNNDAMLFFPHNNAINYPMNHPSICIPKRLKHPETVDGNDPTSQYGVYWLIKRGAFNLNQREYDVIDDKCNLLYTTKIVPGTIACFDVLDGKTNQSLLRVTVDISRRYWSIYRFRYPVFENQIPDKIATHQLFMNDSKFQHEFMNYQYQLKQQQLQQLQQKSQIEQKGANLSEQQEWQQQQQEQQEQQKQQEEQQKQQRNNIIDKDTLTIIPTAFKKIGDNFRNIDQNLLSDVVEKVDSINHKQTLSIGAMESIASPADQVLSNTQQAKTSDVTVNEGKARSMQSASPPSSVVVADVPSPGLYKVCCVTVSWSRYMAVSTMFGPPSDEEIQHYNRFKRQQQERFVEEQQRQHQLQLQQQQRSNGIGENNKTNPSSVDMTSNSPFIHSTAINSNYKKEQLFDIAKSYWGGTSNSSTVGVPCTNTNSSFAMTCTSDAVTKNTDDSNVPYHSTSSVPSSANKVIMSLGENVAERITAETTTGEFSSIATSTLRQQKSLVDEIMSDEQEDDEDETQMLDKEKKGFKTTHRNSRNLSVTNIGFEVELASAIGSSDGFTSSLDADDNNAPDEQDEKSRTYIEKYHKDNFEGNEEQDEMRLTSTVNTTGSVVLPVKATKTLLDTRFADPDVSNRSRETDRKNGAVDVTDAVIMSLPSEVDCSRVLPLTHKNKNVRCRRRSSTEDETHNPSITNIMFQANMDDDKVNYDAADLVKSDRLLVLSKNEFAQATSTSTVDSVKNETNTTTPSAASAIKSSMHSSISAASASIANLLLLSNNNNEAQVPPTVSPSLTSRKFKEFVNYSITAAGLTSSSTSSNNSAHVKRKLRGDNTNEASSVSVAGAEKSSSVASAPLLAVDDPMEGTIDMDTKPIMLCQEIYTRIIGNWQSSRISKSKALELLKRDMLEHEQDEEKKKTNSNNTGKSSTSTSSGSSIKQPALLPRRKSIEDEDNTNTLILSLEQQVLAEAHEASIEMQLSQGGGIEEFKEDRPSSSQSKDNEEDENNDDNDDAADIESEQPLTGYWNWENTLRTHKMKMHVAAGSDLAMHVVMAILVNQVRYERNAIAFVA